MRDRSAGGRPDAHRGLAVPAVDGGPHPDDLLVHGGLDAVVLLDVELGQRVALEGGGVLEVPQRGGVHDVPAQSIKEETRGSGRT